MVEGRDEQTAKIYACMGRYVVEYSQLVHWMKIMLASTMAEIPSRRPVMNDVQDELSDQALMRVLGRYLHAPEFRSPGDHKIIDEILGPVHSKQRGGSVRQERIPACTSEFPAAAGFCRQVASDRPGPLSGCMRLVLMGEGCLVRSPVAQRSVRASSAVVSPAPTVRSDHRRTSFKPVVATPLLRVHRREERPCGHAGRAIPWGSSLTSRGTPGKIPPSPHSAAPKRFPTAEVLCSPEAALQARSAFD